MTSTNQKYAVQSNDRFLRFPEVKERVGFSRSQIHLLINQGRFPSPIKLCGGTGGRASGWLESEVNTWIAERVAESRDHGGVAA
jgi:prophage regulatory protein